MSIKPIAELGVAHFKGISVKEKGAEGRYVLVPSGAVFPEHIKLDRCKRFTDDPAKLSQKFLQANDVLFNSGGVGTLGRSHHISEIEPETYVPDSFVLVLRTNGEQLLSKYLYYYLQSPAAKQLIEDNTRGTIGITSIKSEAVLGFPISCPSLVEQQRIVRQLDDVIKGIAIAKANAEKNLQSARAIFGSYLETSYLRKQSKRQAQLLGDLCRVKTGQKDVNEGNPKGMYPFFTCAETHTFSDSYSFDTEALLIAGNGNVGQVEYFKGKFEAYQRTYVLDEFRGVTAKYLYHILKTQLSKAVSKKKLGTAMPYIKKGMLTDYQVYVPTIEEQEDACEQFDELTTRIDTLARLYEQKVFVFEELKNSVMARFFSGKAEAVL